MAVRSRIHRDSAESLINIGGADVLDLRDHSGSLRHRRPPAGPRPARPEVGKPDQLRESKLFGSPAFRRLWFAQVFSSLGDWIGFIAITAIANRVGGGASAGLGAVALVLSARLIPGFFFSPFAGVLIDRLNRKTVMVVSDFGRAVVLCALPFVQNLPGLFLASLILELFTLMWSPAKEASVPKLVNKDFLPTANSLSLVAAYGTFPFASAVFAILAQVPTWVGGNSFFDAINPTKESVALYFDALTYLISAAVIATLVIVRQSAIAKREPDKSRTKEGLEEAREGWRYIRTNVRVRSVIIGLATGLVGGGMVVPLGPAFATDALHAGSSGYGLLLSGLGTGVAIGIVGLTVFQKRLPIDKSFVVAILGAGASLIAAASMSGLGAAVLFIGLLGLFAGAVYVLGFTSVQMNSVDEMRGRVFATLYTLTRFCILIALTAAPLLSLLFNSISENYIGGSITILPGMHVSLPGVRITLWLGGSIVVAAGLLAARSLRRPADAKSA